MQENHVTAISEEHEQTCWGCGLRLLLVSYSPVFKCGWCGAITNPQNRIRKPDSTCFSLWRRIRDRFFVSVLLLFMSFVICAGFWAVYPVVFSINYFCGVFHSTITAILSLSSLSTFCLASFKSAGTPLNITWGSYPVVGKDSLENFTFCAYCEKPKPPRAHHCRSCRICVLDMDHHCPFIGNCVGAANHQYFIFFLISIVVSCSYVIGMTSYAAFHTWPSNHEPSALVTSLLLKQILSGIATSVLSLSARGIILIYLAFACISVEIGIAFLLWQQLCYIYEGKTYVNHIKGDYNMGGERGCQNILRFFSCPYLAYRMLLIPSNAAKMQESSSKIL
ncbi:hypothetical protein HPP92_024425 [Vanilla planifolia]|uniref:S-acyltransferase n=1 Tax=Vanilla planifolia TaxID=51239 RepID=A0A835PPR8_VANPL|nr:hypothetical protein HPP92_024425 [Vanilla planifolia]